MVDRRGGGEAQREEEEVLHGGRGLASVDLLGNGRTCGRYRWKGRSAGVVRRRRGQYVRELVGPPEVSLHSLDRRKALRASLKLGPPWGTRACGWDGGSQPRQARSASMHGVVRADRKENPLAWPTPLTRTAEWQAHRTTRRVHGALRVGTGRQGMLLVKLGGQGTATVVRHFVRAPWAPLPPLSEQLRIHKLTRRCPRKPAVLELLPLWMKMVWRDNKS